MPEPPHTTNQWAPLQPAPAWRWWWDGRSWMATSLDGCFSWDGVAWRPRLVPAPALTPAVLTTGFRSGASRARWAVLGLAALVAVNLWAIAAAAREAQLTSRTLAGDVVSSSDIDAADHFLLATTVFTVVVGLMAAVAFLVWLHRAVANLEALGGTAPRFTPGWAVGWFFVPLLNFVMPYLVVSNVWRLSDPAIGSTVSPGAAAEGGRGRTAARVGGSALVLFWWVLVVGTGILDRVARGLSRGGDPTNVASWDAGVHTWSIVAIVASSLAILAALLAILILRRIEVCQRARWLALQPAAISLPGGGAPSSQTGGAGVVHSRPSPVQGIAMTAGAVALGLALIGTTVGVARGSDVSASRPKSLRAPSSIAGEPRVDPPGFDSTQETRNATSELRRQGVDAAAAGFYGGSDADPVHLLIALAGRGLSPDQGPSLNDVLPWLGTNEHLVTGSEQNVARGAHTFDCGQITGDADAAVCVWNEKFYVGVVFELVSPVVGTTADFAGAAWDAALIP